MRKAWRAFGVWLANWLGWELPPAEIRLEYAVKTQFRGCKPRLELREWQSLAQVFRACPDLEDFLQLKLNDLDAAHISVDADGDRLRLVNHAQRDVLRALLALPETASARVEEALKAKKVPKGNSHV